MTYRIEVEEGILKAAGTAGVAAQGGALPGPEAQNPATPLAPF
jgi:hypothetical protein